MAGDEIKPVVFLFKNVRVDEKLSCFKYEGSLMGEFALAVEDDRLTFSGTVDGACAGVRHDGACGGNFR